MKVIELNEEHKVQIINLIRSVAIEFVVSDFTQEGQDYYLEKVKSDVDYCIENENCRYIGVLERNEVIGVCGFSFSGHISQLFVKASEQTKGLGTLLLQQAILECGVQEITVNASLNAVPYYLSKGFHARDLEKNNHGVRYVPMSRGNS